MLHQVLPASAAFDALLYLGTIHAVCPSRELNLHQEQPCQAAAVHAQAAKEACRLLQLPLPQSLVPRKTSPFQASARCTPCGDAWMQHDCQRQGPAQPMLSCSVMPGQETALEELEAGREALRAAGSERTGQLKALVKQNFDRFISCKTTIDDVHKRLREAELGNEVSGEASTGEVVSAITEVGGCVTAGSIGAREGSCL